MARIKKLQRRVKRINKKIRGLGPDQQEQKDRLVKRRSGIQDKIGNEVLSNPNQVAKGRTARYAARSLANLTTRPAIDEQRRLIQSLMQDTNRDTGKLNQMGSRLDGQMKYLSGKQAEYGREAYGQSVASGDALQNRLRQNSDKALNRTNELQSSVLGQKISALQGANIDPSSSGSAQIMGQFAQANNQAAANNAQSWENTGATMAAAANSATQAGNTAAQNSLNNKAIDIQRNITTRVADRMYQGSQAKQDAQSKLATLKGLKGAEYVNQLMKIRGGEREFINSRQANALEKLAITTQAVSDDKDRALKKYEIDQDAASGGSGGGNGGDKDDVRLGKQEWRNFRDAADQHLGNGKVGNWKNFFDAVGKIEGVNWTATERRKFAKRYKKYYRRNR
jgi:hypothetical protein